MAPSFAPTRRGKIEKCMFNTLKQNKMKKINILRSLRDLAAYKAKELCSEDKPYYKQFLEVYEKKIIDDLVKEAIDSENNLHVQPVIQQYAEKNTDIPIPFEVDGKPVNQIRVTGESYCKHCEASFNGEQWYYLGNDDKLRLYEALDEAGCLDKLN